MVETLSPVLSQTTERKINEILQRLSDTGCTLSTAESCTGGLLSSLFTDVPGHSHVFVAGITAYSEDAKSRILGIPRESLEVHGAVSEEVAKHMALAALALTNTDFAVAVTGFADGGGKDAEAGLVHFATAQKAGPVFHKRCQFGDQGRGAVRLLCIKTAVTMLHQQIIP